MGRGSVGRRRRWAACSLWLGAAIAFGACDDDTAPAALDARTVGGEACAAGCTSEAELDAGDEGLDASDEGDDATDAGLDAAAPSSQPEPDAGSGRDAGLDCTVGDTSACTAAQDCYATRLCLSPGTWGECSCVPVPRPHLVGAPCTSDLDCGPELQCWSADHPLSGVEGSPAGGYCTRPCVGYTGCPEGSDCRSIAEMTGDTSQPSQSLCWLRCINDTSDPLIEERNCRSRSELACWADEALRRTSAAGSLFNTGPCLPLCGSDADCPGRYCTPGRYLSLCTDQPPPPPPPIGAACSADTDCGPTGICQFSDNVVEDRACTQICRWDTASSCGYGPEVPGSEREYLCLGAYRWEYDGVWGQGRAFEAWTTMISTCLQTCDQDSDCRQAGVYTCSTAGFDDERRVCRGPSIYDTPPVDAGVPDGG